MSSTAETDAVAAVAVVAYYQRLYKPSMSDETDIATSLRMTI